MVVTTMKIYPDGALHSDHQGTSRGSGDLSTKSFIDQLSAVQCNVAKNIITNDKTVLYC